MVDFVLVIQRAVDNLPENTPEMRSHIYERARVAVSRQLESMNPRIPRDILERQLSKLEKAILQVERKNKKFPRALDKDRVLVAPKSHVNSKKNIFLTSRLTSISSILRNRKHKKTVDIVSTKGNKKTTTHRPYQLRDILHLSSNVQQGSNAQILSMESIEYNKNRLRRDKLLRKFSVSSSRSIFFLLQSYFSNKIRVFLSSYTALSEYHFFKQSVFLVVFLGMMMGLSYSFWQNKVSFSHILENKISNRDSDNKKVLHSLGSRPKITRRLLANGSEVDMGTAISSPINSSNTSNVFFKNHIDSNDQAVSHILESKKSGTENPIDEDGRVFINQGSGRSSIFAGNIFWSLQKEKTQGLKGLVIKGDIPTINNAFSASITLKCNADIALSVTHLMEITFSFPKESQNSIVDLRQISMRKTENSPSILIDSNIFRISKNSYLISLKGDAEDFLRNSKILEEYRWIDIPITYHSGQKITLTIDKGKVGSDVFKSAVMDWKDHSK
ncbi:hypothetical protein AYO25_01615 [Candidatus Liberibacter solanacearum]|uniref:Uncharacterized protein n=1 Tax=Candidatus Liberibacter solanacearum TaxID=556287 RepID=A0A1V2N8K6_9HYPH|nr:hypothetical protein AYJ09_00140 [Candidatus Liberibacter solanacearum]ONI59995.1 hypothetical protein AYO25_01615 [Candidatus Liberibacter solanacearum]